MEAEQSTTDVAKAHGADFEPTNATPGSTSSQYHNIQTYLLLIIAFLMLTQALFLAASIVIPIAFALVLALALRPVVRKLKGYGLPNQIGAIIVVSVVAFFLGAVLYNLVTPANEWLAKTPVESKLRELRQRLAPLEEPLKKVNKATQQVSDIAAQTGEVAEENEVSQVVVQGPSFLPEILISSWQLTAGIFLCFVTTYFILAEGESLLNEKDSATSQYLPSMNRYTSIIRDVELSVSHYLLTVTVINVCLGIAVWIACWLIGLPSPFLWGVVACTLNFLPYLGAVIGTVIIALVSLLTFESIAYAALAPAVYLSLTSIEGYFLTPSIMGRSMSLNPLIVVLFLAYCSWLWGISGAILSVPLLAILISVGKQFDFTRPLASALSR